MSLRTGARYLEALRDGRLVWLDGQRVDDVTAHPQLAGAARSLAENFDVQRDPAHAELLTVLSPRTGEPMGRQWHVPRSVDDLTKGREMFEFWERRAGGVLGRHPQYMALLLMGVNAGRGRIATVNSIWAENIERYWDYCRENDLAIAFSAIDPHRDRTRPASTMEYFQVVEQRPDGVVVRGAQMAATHSVYADEYLCICNRPGPDQQTTFCCCIPIATEGLNLVCRPSLSYAGQSDHPLASRWDEMDVWVIFDDVFVPNDRVFLLPNDAGVTAGGPVTWGFWYGMVRQLIKDEALVGICFAATEYLGTRDVPGNQALLAEAVAALEGLRAVIVSAEQNAVISVDGLAIPNPSQVAVARVLDLQTHARLLEITRLICGSSLIVAPGQADLSHPEIGPLLQRYVAGADERSPDRFKLMKLAWDYVIDSFGGRQLLFEEHNSGNLTVRRVGLLNAYDAGPVVELAKHLAGIGHSDAVSSHVAVS